MGFEGPVGMVLDIDTSGRVFDCSVVKSSSYPQLDELACNAMIRFARFSPARDESGANVPDTYGTTIVYSIRR